MVGQTLGTRLTQLGHEVRMGSRDAGNEKARKWVMHTGPRASQLKTPMFNFHIAR
jgi:8-hydroxy-5-deazaflavin:NADPH oxidoreductase